MKTCRRVTSRPLGPVSNTGLSGIVAVLQTFLHNQVSLQNIHTPCRPASRCRARGLGQGARRSAYPSGLSTSGVRHDRSPANRSETGGTRRPSHRARKPGAAAGRAATLVADDVPRYPALGRRPACALAHDHSHHAIPGGAVPRPLRASRSIASEGSPHRPVQGLGRPRLSSAAAPSARFCQAVPARSG